MGSVLGAQSRAVDEMLFLTAGVFGADLLAIDALDRETLYRKPVSMVAVVVCWKYYPGIREMK